MASSEILRYQQKVHREYSEDVGLPKRYTYPDGNPIRALPPVKTKPKGLMIVGAYPSARFESRPPAKQNERRRLVPIADNLQPFGREEYFDGVKVRELESASGLDKYLLSHLKIDLEDCWVTDLVKVFLYKKSHLESCNAVHPKFKVHVLRDNFKELGKKSLPWLKEECELCEPRLVLTMGLEVAQVVSGELSAKADDLLARKISYPESIKGYPTLYLPHPDACRRYSKWENKTKSMVPTIKKAI